MGWNNYMACISNIVLKKWTKYLFLKAKLNIIIKSIYKKEYRIWLFKRIIRGRQKLN